LGLKIETTFIYKIPPPSLCQPTVGALSKGGINIPSLEKRGKGRFFNVNTISRLLITSHLIKL
jgi:hypothetical protein